ncbi:hypothetical protein AB0I52_27130 [Streptomyces sp. NPDC050423]|uniref:hypothetical protein n=1 Tax=Streptomyces sp. NPDC050423 TaxID=3155402 RepID=UPI00343C7F41
MHRTTVVSALALTTALLTAASPASAGTPAASDAGTGTGWEPAPTAPFDATAGARCDFPIHGEPVVDEVVQKVLATRPDGSPSQIAYKGALVIRVTNTDTGAFHDADAGGSALVDHHADGSQRWHAIGPVLAGIGGHDSNLPRGEQLIDGIYTLDISSAGYKTLHMIHGSTDDICAHIG